MASLQMTKQSQKAPPEASLSSNNGGLTVTHLVEKQKPVAANNVDAVEKVQVHHHHHHHHHHREVHDQSSQLQFKRLEEDHIEQMIEELLDYGSIELCSVLPTQAQAT